MQITSEDPNIIKHLNEEIEAKDTELEQRNLAIRALSDQVEQKDNVIREQAENLDEYRMEILHLRGENIPAPDKPCSVGMATEQVMPKLAPIRKKGKNTQLDISEPDKETKMIQSNVRAVSEEGDSSWSEPGKMNSRIYFLVYSI